MKDIVFNLPDYMVDYNEAELHIFSDLHIGDKHCDLDSIYKRVEEVKNKPNAFILLNGDLLNNAIPNSLSDSIGEALTPMQECERVVEIFSSVADKVIAVTSGNHENRTYKQVGIDIAKMYCLEMGIADRYTKEGALIFLYGGRISNGKKETNHPDKVRGISYVIYMNHGQGGSRSVGSKLNKLESLSSICDADIYIMGHTHLPATFREGYVRVDPRNKKHYMIDKLFVNMGSSLNYGGYGEQFLYRPSSKESPIVHIGMHNKWYKATL